LVCSPSASIAAGLSLAGSPGFIWWVDNTKEYTMRPGNPVLGSYSGSEFILQWKEQSRVAVGNTTRHLGATLFKSRLHQVWKSHVTASMHHGTWGLMQVAFQIIILSTNPVVSRRWAGLSSFSKSQPSLILLSQHLRATIFSSLSKS
jgi:hypothetical protein